MAIIIGPTLPDPYYSIIKSVRDDLVAEFGVDEYTNPFPHFTLYPLDDDVDTTAVEVAVEEAVKDHDPVSIHTDGIGIFLRSRRLAPSREITPAHSTPV